MAGAGPGPGRPGPRDRRGGADLDRRAVEAQVRRILSLDRSAVGYAAVGDCDPVVRRLLEASDYLRPVCFYSAYEAAAWSVLVGRGRMAQAASLRARIAAELGERFTVDGIELYAFPTPDRLLDAEMISGAGEEPLARLRGVAEAARAGLLDTARLAAMAPEDAMREARRIRGIGPFYAALIYVRAGGAVDYLAVGEPRLHAAVKQQYGLAQTPGTDELTDIAAAWAPYRTWVNVLLRASTSVAPAARVGPLRRGAQEVLHQHRDEALVVGQARLEVHVLGVAAPAVAVARAVAEDGVGARVVDLRAGAPRRGAPTRSRK